MISKVALATIANATTVVEVETSSREIHWISCGPSCSQIYVRS
jgi:hypothetical protein